MIIKLSEALEITPADLFIRDVSKNQLEMKKEIKVQIEKIIASLN